MTSSGVRLWTWLSAGNWCWRHRMTSCLGKNDRGQLGASLWCSCSEGGGRRGGCGRLHLYSWGVTAGGCVREGKALTVNLIGGRQALVDQDQRRGAGRWGDDTVWAHVVININYTELSGHLRGPGGRERGRGQHTRRGSSTRLTDWPVCPHSPPPHPGDLHTVTYHVTTPQTCCYPSYLPPRHCLHPHWSLPLCSHWGLGSVEWSGTLQWHTVWEREDQSHLLSVLTVAENIQPPSDTYH